MSKEEKSYQQYKQYRRNRYRYEWEQIIFPITVLLILFAAISFRKQLLIAFACIAAIVVAYLLYQLYSAKQIYISEPIILTPQEAQQGTELDLFIRSHPATETITAKIPPNSKDGQKILLRNITIINEKGKRQKKNLHLKLQVKNGQ